MRRSIEYCFLAFLLGSIAFFGLAFHARAAVLFVSPSSENYLVGETFNVSVQVSSSDQAINAASGIVSFPIDKLEVKSISKSSSIFNFWVQEPSFSNSSGTVSFEGVVLNPGYIGGGGKILNIVFGAKRAGTAPLSFTSSSVLANDGLGTDILTGTSRGSFTITNETDKSETETTLVPPSASSESTLTSATKITSSTHPNQDKWYNNADPEFSWSVPKGTTAVQTLVDNRSSSIPIITYDEPISEKRVTDMSDGIWYFHARFNDGGDWGETSHFKFRVDTEKPSEFDIKEIKRGDLTIPQAKFTFRSFDETSGISHYEVKIDEAERIEWKDDGSGIYVTPASDPGIHTLTARAVDKAGNYLETTSEFEVEPLETPTIEEHPDKIRRGEKIIVKGDAKYSNSVVSVFIQRGSGEIRTYEVSSEEDKSFTFILEGQDDNVAYTLEIATNNLKSGTYRLWAVVTDSRGAKSNPSEKITFTVEGFSWAGVGSWLIRVLTIAIPIIALLMLLAFIFWFGWYKFNLIKKKLRKEILEAENNLHKAFALLRENVLEQIKLLEGTENERALTKEEKKVVKELRKNLSESEKFVEKELKDIKNILK